MADSQEITRKSASNLALSFVLLPRPKRVAMAALYAFCRSVDDVADEDSAPVDIRRSKLAEWREDVRRAFDGGTPSFPVNRELVPVIRDYRLCFDRFDELIRGCEMDLERDRYPDWPELEAYCHHVASVVGLLSIEIFGYRDPACREYAVELGRALQLTNIVRDVGNDALRGRIYLPLSELRRASVEPESVLARRETEGLRQVAASVAAVARRHYAAARAVRDALPREDRKSMIAAEIMGTIYWALLRELERRRYPVLAHPHVRLPGWRKLVLMAQAAARASWGVRLGEYGN